MTKTIELPARPENISLAIDQTAVIIVDMQNAYCSPGGYIDLNNRDISAAPACIANIQRMLAASREAGLQIVFLQNGWDKDYVEAGTPLSPNYHKSNAMRLMRRDPNLKGQLLAKGGWDYELVDELKPEPQDIIVPKPRYSAFFNTQLDSILRSRGIRNLIFVGVATNVCVESTLRDGFHLEYFGVMLEDAAYAVGPDFIQKATVFNVENFFGWVSNVDDYCAALKSAS